MAGDCLKPSTFQQALADVDAVVHCVGLLFETKGLTYTAVNRDSCINMAYELNEYAKTAGKKRNFVMISSAKAPFFAPRYLSTKEEAEKYLLDECAYLQPTIIKPGVILNTEHRWWGVGVGAGNDAVWWLNETLIKTIMPKKVTDATDFLIPARSTQLSTIEHFTLKGIKGECEYRIVGPQEYTTFERSSR